MEKASVHDEFMSFKDSGILGGLKILTMQRVLWIVNNSNLPVLLYGLPVNPAYVRRQLPASGFLFVSRSWKVQWKQYFIYSVVCSVHGEYYSVQRVSVLL